MGREVLSMPPVPADRRISYGKDPSQFVDIWNGGETRTRVIMIHGGFWRSQYDLLHVSPLCAVLASAGFPVASLEYRRVGKTGGGWPQTFVDVEAGISAAQASVGGSAKSIIMGHSAGGHLALRTGADLELAGVVALAPVASLHAAYDAKLGLGAVADFLGGSPDEIPQIYAAADPARFQQRQRALVLHGTKDDVVPLTISRSYLQSQRGSSGRVKLVEIEDADHFDLIDPQSKAWPGVLSAIRQLERPSGNS